MKYIAKEANKVGWCTGCIMNSVINSDVCESFADERFAEGLPHCFEHFIIYVEGTTDE